MAKLNSKSIKQQILKKEQAKKKVSDFLIDEERKYQEKVSKKQDEMKQLDDEIEELNSKLTLIMLEENNITSLELEEILLKFKGGD